MMRKRVFLHPDKITTSCMSVGSLVGEYLVYLMTSGKPVRDHNLALVVWGVSRGMGLVE